MSEIAFGLLTEQHLLPNRLRTRQYHHFLAKFGQGFPEERIIKDTALLIVVKSLSKAIEDRLTTALELDLDASRLTI